MQWFDIDPRIRIRSVEDCSLIKAELVKVNVGFADYDESQMWAEIQRMYITWLPIDVDDVVTSILVWYIIDFDIRKNGYSRDVIYHSVRLPTLYAHIETRDIDDFDLLRCLDVDMTKAFVNYLAEHDNGIYNKVAYRLISYVGKYCTKYFNSYGNVDFSENVPLYIVKYAKMFDEETTFKALIHRITFIYHGTYCAEEYTVRSEIAKLLCYSYTEEVKNYFSLIELPGIIRCHFDDDLCTFLKMYMIVNKLAEDFEVSADMSIKYIYASSYKLKQRLKMFMQEMDRSVFDGAQMPLQISNMLHYIRMDGYMHEVGYEQTIIDFYDAYVSMCPDNVVEYRNSELCYESKLMGNYYCSRNVYNKYSVVDIALDTL